VIIKANKKPRIVIDLSRNLNDYLLHTPFNYTRAEDAVTISTPLCWYGKLDLTNCFLSFPLHPEVQQYFVFFFQNKLYQFTRMPFGLSTAPLVCTQLLSVVAFALTQIGTRFVRYLDDFLFAATTAAELQQTLSIAQKLIVAYGLVVNGTKTEGPIQRISFLGILIDSVSQTLSCTKERVQELREILTLTSAKHLVKKKWMESFIGKLSFAAQVLPGARPFMRRLQDSILHVKRRSDLVVITPLVHADIDFWLDNLSSWNGAQVWRSSRQDAIHFASDASLQGFGFHLMSNGVPAHIDTKDWPSHLLIGNGFSGLYDPTHAQYHDSHKLIGWCELLAVYAAAVTYAPVLQNRCVIFHIDNLGDNHIINRQATRSPVLAGILRALYKLALTYNINISAEHIRGVDNVLADFLSRPEHHKHKHISQWKKIHPSLSVQLSCVSILSSLKFVDKESMPQSISSPQ
jgi:hypothetical protein